MAESIVTLGIGATPVSLTPFVTGGLFSAAVVPTVAMVSLTSQARGFALTSEARDFGLTSQARDFTLTAVARDES